MCWIVGHQGPSSSEREPLLRGPRYPRVASTHGESTVNWFSPVETPEASPRPRRPGEQLILTQDQRCVLEFELGTPKMKSESYPLCRHRFNGVRLRVLGYVLKRRVESTNPHWASVVDYGLSTFSLF
ncbi:jg6516 [Pararge aegeria aegeria]|uniref:Jg6516 protein n=1 Tax=Pararge aegeria aegeria TaxID=348720 RepID=A0A8S4S610_9NEOP|nr:jg6516 [Pararge aegeria aegeria]